MEIPHGKILARPDRFRATVALAAPFLFLGAIALTLVDKGYSPLDYVTAIASGEVSPLAQIVGWTCAGLWVARYWPSAIEALSANLVLAQVADTLVNARGESVSLASIEDIRLEQSLFNKQIVLEAKKGSTMKQGIIFSSVAGEPLTKLLRGEVSELAVSATGREQKLAALAGESLQQ